ncbi:hypothetical protein R3W88_000942 [Solanum pinnatisectum]|uniref:CCHC-type domain-containing protein n=1 Tax=Solanum pinnatisectum TaxID=50273 RepID=A0AAV9MGW4_9SOLN|nr:hypothetical protein R3W88_000942 [Solanum pinnatisectum]
MEVTSIEKAELAAYQLKDVAQIWFTHWKANRPVRAGPIERELLKEAFLGRYFPREKREVKVDEFINLRQGNMNVQEYSLKFIQLSKYAPSLVCNPRDEMSRFVMGISDLVEEECHTEMVHDDMNISRLMVCGKKHFGKCLAGTSGCYGCGKNDHQVKDCPTLTARGRVAKQTSLKGSDLDVPKWNHIYALQANKDKGANPDEGTSK